MDEKLKNLITKIRQYDPGTPQQQKALNQLLILIEQLPGIYKSSHQDYPEAYNRTLEWVCKNIDRFESRSPSITNDFVIWINGYLKWRIRDLYIPDSKFNFINIRTEDDSYLEASSRRECFAIENLCDPRFSLSLLDRQIAEMQATKQQRQGEALRQYIEQDPQKILTNCHLRKCPECHCQLLAMQLLLSDPPKKISDLSREYNLNNQTLYSHWKQKCLPLLQEIASQIGNR
jgi:hypothetical protein